MVSKKEDAKFLLDPGKFSIDLDQADSDKSGETVADAAKTEGMDIFSRVKATLYAIVSVCWSVGRLRIYFFGVFRVVSGFPGFRGVSCPTAQ